MTHDQLYDKCLKAMGGTVPLAFRAQFAEWHAQRKTELWLKYEWITHPGFYTWLVECEDMEWHEGAHGITFWIAAHGRLNH